MYSPPLVSVVIPTRNRALRLRRAIQSACGQTVRELEILVVDDGSTDDTPGVVESAAAADRRVRLIRKDRSAGAPAARNDGIRAAGGELIATLDDDDEWDAAKLET